MSVTLYLGSPIVGEPKPQQERSDQFRRLSAFENLSKGDRVVIDGVEVKPRTAGNRRRAA